MAEHHTVGSHRSGQGRSRQCARRLDYRRTSRRSLTCPDERRSVFVVPFVDAPYTYVGTTDTAYAGPLDDPRAHPRTFSTCSAP